MRKKMISIFLIALLLLGSMALASCKKSPEEVAAEEEPLETIDIDEFLEEEESEDDFDASDLDDPAYDNEGDEVTVTKVGHKEEDFYGSWSATSQLSHHLYGNADFTINKDGSWKGNVTDEDFSGDWEYKNEAVVIKSDDELINYRLFFVEDGNLMFEDLDKEDMIPLVLKKK